MVEKTDIFLIDSSAIFSGKPLLFRKGSIVTTSKIADEFSPGGRDYRTFQLLIEKGMQVFDPTEPSIKIIQKRIKETGEKRRLSKADISLLALAYEIKKADGGDNPIIVTDDYSIQNMASYFDLTTQPVNQKGITKRFKWERRCQGCRVTITDDVDVCPICGSSIKHVIQKSLPVKKLK